MFHDATGIRSGWLISTRPPWQVVRLIHNHIRVEERMFGVTRTGWGKGCEGICVISVGNVTDGSLRSEDYWD